MKLCLQCNKVNYTKRKCKCPCYKNIMIQVDGPLLRKVVESMNNSDFLIAFATCEAYETSDICVAEIVLGFASAYDDFMFKDLPEHFTFITDKYHPSQYTLNYVLNHLGGPMSMVMFEYCRHPSRSKSASAVLQEAIDELSTWSKNIESTGRWAVYKLGGYL